MSKRTKTRAGNQLTKRNPNVVQLGASSLYAWECTAEPACDQNGELLSSAPETLAAVGYDEKLGEAGGLRGVVIAEARLFANQWRGRFAKESLQRIIELWPADGLSSGVQHPSIVDDGLLNLLFSPTGKKIHTINVP